jgi:hypothetical protein
LIGSCPLNAITLDICGAIFTPNCFVRAVIAQSVYRWVTGWTTGVLGYDFRRGLGIFLYTTTSTTALGPTQPPIQWVTEALSRGLKGPGCEADHSPPSSARVKSAWSYTSTPQIRLRGVMLIYFSVL